MAFVHIEPTENEILLNDDLLPRRRSAEPASTTSTGPRRPPTRAPRPTASPPRSER